MAGQAVHFHIYAKSKYTFPHLPPNSRGCPIYYRKYFNLSRNCRPTLCSKTIYTQNEIVDDFLNKILLSFFLLLHIYSTLQYFTYWESTSINLTSDTYLDFALKEKPAQSLRELISETAPRYRTFVPHALTSRLQTNNQTPVFPHIRLGP